MLTIVLPGLAIGSLYAATGIAYNIMYSTSKVLNISTGQLCMLGGVFGAFFVSRVGLPAPLGLLGAVLVGACFGFLTEVVAIRRVLARSDEHLWLLSTLALATILQHAIGLWWGTEPRPFPRVIEQDFAAGLWDQKYWLPIAALVVISIGLEVFVRKTMLGKIFVAVSEDELASIARGIATDRVRAFSYALAGAVGAMAGFAAGQLTFAYFAVGLILTLNGFIALAVGGLGSTIGAVIGGLALGLLMSLATALVGGQYVNTVAIGLLVVVLLVRPEGIFGAKRVRPV